MYDLRKLHLFDLIFKFSNKRLQSNPQMDWNTISIVFALICTALALIVGTICTFRMLKPDKLIENVREDISVSFPTIQSANAKRDELSDSSIPYIRVSKRTEGVLQWDDYFMAVSYLSAMRSKDPSTQVGACIVNPERRIVGIGYNGFPAGCDDDRLPWNRVAEDEMNTKYLYVCHAELNAILNKNSASVKNCTVSPET